MVNSGDDVWLGVGLESDGMLVNDGKIGIEIELSNGGGERIDGVVLVELPGKETEPGIGVGGMKGGWIVSEVMLEKHWRTYRAGRSAVASGVHSLVHDDGGL